MPSLSSQRTYKTVALAEAKRRGLKAADVEAMGYQSVAGLAGVQIGADGSSPKDFFYRQVRRFVGGTIRRELFEAGRMARMEAIQTVVQRVPGESGTKVVVGDDGSLKLEDE